MNSTSKGIWLPVIVGLFGIIYCIAGYLNADFGSGKMPVPWLGAIVFVVCIFWAASKGSGKNRDL
jgi:hypothetical protein